MSEIDIVDTGILTPRIEDIHVRSKYHLDVYWADGERAERRPDSVDLSPAILSYKIYRPLRNNTLLFGSARVIDNGYAVVWNGPDLEMSADLIETLATQTITPAQFAEFLKRNDLTQQEAAAMLGRSRRQIGYYLKEGPIPRVVALACFGFDSLIARRQETDPRPALPQHSLRPRHGESV